MKGTVKFFHNDKGYGFIDLDDEDEEEDVFFHISEISGISVDEDETVEFEVEQGDRGPRAVNVTRV